MMNSTEPMIAEHNTQMLKITRDFQAPRALVFRAWTTPESLIRWFAPQGCSIQIAKMDFQVGGRFLTCISNPSFGECWCKGVYREIVSPERIVYSMEVSDANGDSVDPVAAGHDSDWPRETVVTVTFEEHTGQTRLTLQQTVSESLAKRTGAHPSWLQMLDRLAEELASPQSSR